MKRLLLLGVLISLLNPWLDAAGLQSAGVTTDAQSAAAINLTAAEAQADFDPMRKVLEESHTGLYRFSTKAEMDKVFDAQRAKLNRSITKRELLAVVAGTLAQIKCGHTGMTPDDQFQRAIANAQTFPLQVMIEGRRLMVLLNETPDDRTICPGMEIVEINGRNTSDILNRIMPVVPGDGDVETGRRTSIQKKHTYLTGSINWDVDSFTLSWDGKIIAFVTNEDGLSVLHLFDTVRNQELPAPKLPAGVIGSLEWHRNNRDLGFGLEVGAQHLRHLLARLTKRKSRALDRK